MNKLIITLATSAVLLVLATPAMASTFTGTLSTGVSTGISGIVDAGVSALPAPGTFSSAQSVSLSASGANSIHYFLNTTDLNSALTCSTGSVYDPANPIQMTVSGLVRAIACYGSHAGPMARFTYTISSASTPASSSGGGGGSVAPSNTSSSNTIPGDTNGDGVVNITDFNTLLVNWGKTVTGGVTDGDFNGDGVVNITDFNILITNWTTTP